MIRKRTVGVVALALATVAGGGTATWAAAGAGNGDGTAASGVSAPGAGASSAGASGGTSSGGLFVDVTGKLTKGPDNSGGRFQLVSGSGQRYTVTTGNTGLLVPYVGQRVTVTGNTPGNGGSAEGPRKLNVRLVRSHANNERLLQRGTTNLKYKVKVRGDLPAGTTFYGVFGRPGPDPHAEVPSPNELGMVALRDSDNDGVHTAPVGLENGQRTITQLARGTTEKGPTEIIHPQSIVQQDSTITLDGDTTTSTTYDAGNDQPPAKGKAILTDVRVGKHKKYDRVAFDFSGKLPSYPSVESRDDPVVHESGTGKPVRLKGNSALKVTFEKTRLDGQFRPHLTPGLPAVREVKLVGAFEGYVSFGIGVATEEIAPHVGNDEDSVYIDVPHDSEVGPGPSTRACGDVGFEPNTDHGAFDIRAAGVKCDLARDVAAAAESHNGKRYTAAGFTCRGKPAGTELPSVAYTCTRGENGRVTFSTS